MAATTSSAVAPMVLFIIVTLLRGELRLVLANLRVAVKAGTAARAGMAATGNSGGARRVGLPPWRRRRGAKTDPPRPATRSTDPRGAGARYGRPVVAPPSP